eukprot:516176-Prorocentrum_minimum.AAC.1
MKKIKEQSRAFVVEQEPGREARVSPPTSSAHPPRRANPGERVTVRYLLALLASPEAGAGRRVLLHAELSVGPAVQRAPHLMHLSIRRPQYAAPLARRPFSTPPSVRRPFGTPPL